MLGPRLVRPQSCKKVRDFILEFIDNELKEKTHKLPQVCQEKSCIDDIWGRGWDWPKGEWSEREVGLTLNQQCLFVSQISEKRFFFTVKPIFHPVARLCDDCSHLIFLLLLINSYLQHRNKIYECQFQPKYTPAMSHDAAKVLPKLNVGRNLLLHAQIYWVVATFEAGQTCSGQIWLQL